ncbi:DMT family transporter [Bacillus sp. OK048]|uniref:EamA family transporter n=1 Tax=Bacillus sp. OK048 TaxID=1882761 RepID=UPI0008871074|nr:EamA family transporter [Bacillus sp. OK048]SDN40596.1 Threonine/homoserine efflux transporter RhtA [Bacillus sp. OK048]
MNTIGAVMSYPRTKGILLVLIAATSWGVSGTVAQYLFHQQGFSSSWLVVIRLLLAGTGLLIFSHTVGKQNIWRIWKNKQDLFLLIVFGIFGMLGVQYTFFAAIEQGNAATATVLQYLAPVMIALYLCFHARTLPVKHELIAIVLALGGTFLLVTKGNIHTLAISGPAFGWGILSAFALAFYTLYPVSLLSKWGTALTVGWGMMIGGVGLSFIHPPWKFQGHWSLTSFTAVTFVVIVGTLIAFLCFMESLKYIKASEASLLACIEPLSAAFLAVVWLHVSFSPIEWLGALSIIATIFILASVKR